MEHQGERYQGQDQTRYLGRVIILHLLEDHGLRHLILVLRYHSLLHLANTLRLIRTYGGTINIIIHDLSSIAHVNDHIMINLTRATLSLALHITTTTYRLHARYNGAYNGTIGTNTRILIYTISGLYVLVTGLTGHIVWTIGTIKGVITRNIRANGRAIVRNMGTITRTILGTRGQAQ